MLKTKQEPENSCHDDGVHDNGVTGDEPSSTIGTAEGAAGAPDFREDLQENLDLRHPDCHRCIFEFIATHYCEGCKQYLCEDCTTKHGLYMKTHQHS